MNWIVKRIEELEAKNDGQYKGCDADAWDYSQSDRMFRLSGCTRGLDPYGLGIPLNRHQRAIQDGLA